MGAVLQVGAPEASKVHAEHRVPVHHKEALAQLVDTCQYRTTCSKRFRFTNASEPGPRLMYLLDVGLDFFVAITGQQDDIAKSKSHCQTNLMLDDWNSPYAHERLGQVTDPAAQPRAFSSGKNYCLH